MLKDYQGLNYEHVFTITKLKMQEYENVEINETHYFSHFAP